MAVLYFVAVSLLLGCTNASPQKQLQFTTGSGMTVLSLRLNDEAFFKCWTNDVSANVTLWHRSTPYENEKMLSSQTGANSEFKVYVEGLFDAGLYLCRAANVKGQRVVKVFLVVIDTLQPSVKIEPRRSQTVSPGESTSFNCVGTPGQLTWYKVEERVLGGYRTLVRIKTMPGSTESVDGENKIQRFLSLQNVQESDSGLYECQLVYRNIKRRKIARLTVRMAPKIAHDGRSTFELHEGDATTLPCRVSGAPRPMVKWSKNGMPVSEENSRYTKAANGLRIRHAHFPEDQGKFVCVAKNSLGSDAISLDVVIKIAPEMEKPEKTEVIRRGHRAVSLKCRVKRSNPLPEFTWKFRLGTGKTGRNWLPLPRQVQRGIWREGPLTSVLKISHKTRLPPKGVSFRCEARNGQGKAAEEFKVYQI